MAERPKANYRRWIRILWIILLSPILLLILLVAGVGIFTTLPDTEQLQNPRNNLASEIFTSDRKTLGKYYAENRVVVKYKDLNPAIVKALIATEDVRFHEHSGVDGRGLVRVVFRTIIGGDQSSGGGSTISQQLAKMLFPRERRTSKLKMVIRKVQEWIIAVKLEREYTKEEIITMYLNKFDFLNNAVGIKSAAQIYFNSTPDKLSVEQSATLVGMAKNPSIFNPASTKRRSNGSTGRDTTQHRRNVVMSQMVKYGFLEPAKYDSLKKIPLKLDFHPEDHNEGLAPYFREYIRERFLKKWCEENLRPDGKKYDLYRDGLRIFTTIDSRMQKHAEEAVVQHMTDLQSQFFKEKKKNFPFSWRVSKEDIDKIMRDAMRRSDRYRNQKENKIPEEKIFASFQTKVPMKIFTWKGDKDTIMTPYDSIRYYKSFLQCGFMSMEPQTGYVRTWVGGINHRHFKYDHVRESRRQVGSTFKPFVYALAIQEGWSPCKPMMNVKECVEVPTGPEWCPENSDAKLNGQEVTLKRALAQSINYITAHIIKRFGPEAVVQFARRVGITAPLEAVYSIALGTCDVSVFEMVGANSTFANKGTWIEPTFITRIEDKNGKVLAEFVPKSHEVMNEEKAYVMINLMQGVVESGTGQRLRYKYKLNTPIAGKTGTTQNNSDGWFIGLTPDLAGGVWVGGEDRSVHFDRTAQGQGASMALPIWGIFMQKVYADKSIKISKGAFERPSSKIEIELDCKKVQDADDGNDDNNLFDGSDDLFGGY